MEYPWYKIVDGKESPLQGDFLDSCPIVKPLHPSEFKKVEIKSEIVEYDVIILSQSCDLEQKKVDLVLVCPVWPLNVIERENSYYKSKKAKESLRRGNIPSYHLLNKCELKGFENDFLIVDFHNVFSVSYGFIIAFIAKNKQRLRLLSPYREHLSQAFARFFMRVGLPIDIPSFL